MALRDFEMAKVLATLAGFIAISGSIFASHVNSISPFDSYLLKLYGGEIGAFVLGESK